MQTPKTEKRHTAMKVMLSDQVAEQMQRIAQHSGISRAAHGAIAVAQYAAANDPERHGKQPASTKEPT